MKYCCECGKELQFYEGYIHPIHGKKNLVCYKCFNYITVSLDFYQNCLSKGRQNHKNECYFWDSKQKKCKNENYFKIFKKNSLTIFSIFSLTYIGKIHFF